jgi:hypothetical protein
MRRSLWLAFGLLAGMMEVGGAARAAVGQHEKMPVDSVDTDSEIRKLLAATLPQLRSTELKNQEAAVREIHEKLAIAANTRDAYPHGDEQRRLSEELVRIFKQTRNSDFSDPGVRLGIIYDLARYGDNDVAKPLILSILDRGKKEERAEALRGIGSPGGISGDDLYEKIVELARRGVITNEAKMTYLSRVDKNRALEKILDEIRSTKDRRAFLYAAWTLQDSYHRPSDFKEILPRLKELGLTKDKSFDGKSAGLFWINTDLLAAYVDIAKGNDLKLALGMMAQYGSLTRPSSAPALMRQLKNPDPEVRVLAAQALEKVMGRSHADRKTINAALKSALQNEKDPQAKISIQDVILRITRANQEWRDFLDRTRKARGR